MPADQPDEDPPTLATLARRLGVHVSTVSRALSNDPGVRGTVSPATVARIRAVATEIGYVPNRFGASLRTGRSRALGVLVPHTSEFVVGAIYEGLDTAAAELGYATFVANTFDDPRVRSVRMAHLRQWGVEAILYADARLGEDELPTVGRIPCVPIVRYGAARHRLHADDREGGRQVARHLLERGYRDAAVITGPRYASTSHERAVGFLEEYRSLGGHVDPGLVVDSTFEVSGGRRATMTILERGLPSAIVTGHDLLALGVYGVAREHDIDIGSQLGIVGYNDLELSAQLPVPLTSVRWDFHALGRAIAIETIASLEGRQVQIDIPTPHLVARASTCGWSGSS
ncbi:LacI family DNA-binding transcriptional regulator [Ornithinimicrobium cavernae]|uniref:LacI family DNA-binding transcriptional regulator n=1 Tax=Ornithinimicrobium cavernae TaxID=2666047 RepID=UPI00137A1C95|nr:LacI family DNA-binding transcriptional regulator [Ornithinimicrobium cavernae]